MNNPVSIEPWLTVAYSKTALDFYKSAFDAIEVYRIEGEDDDLVAKLSIGGAGFWIANGAADSASKSPGSIRLILTVADPDTVFKKALEAGATQVYPVSEEHGWKLGRLADPFGFHWEIGHPVNLH